MYADAPAPQQSSDPRVTSAPTGQLQDFPHPFALASVIMLVWLFGVARAAVPAAALTRED